MKPLHSLHLLKAPIAIKALAFLSISIASLYLGKGWSESGGYQQQQQQLIFFSSPSASPASAHQVAPSPTSGKSFDLSDLILQGPEETVAPPPNVGSSESFPTAMAFTTPPPTPPMAPPSPPKITRLGVVDENGTMSDDFEVGVFDQGFVDDWKNNGSELETSGSKVGGGGGQITIKRYQLCHESMSEYIPCLDNVEAIKKLNSTEKRKKFERHCPDKDKGLNCLIPPPRRYRRSIPWPRSRDEVIIS